MPRCKSQIAPKKTQCLSCFTRNFRYMLTPFQAAGDSKSKVFGGPNLFKCLLMQSVVYRLANVQEIIIKKVFNMKNEI